MFVDVCYFVLRDLSCTYVHFLISLRFWTNFWQTNNFNVCYGSHGVFMFNNEIC